jgi:transposase-like protein
MDEREQQRKVRHRLAMLRHAEEVSGNVAATCRYYGISRQAFYKWQHRFEELGEAGLRDNSSRPHHSPNATDPEIIGKLIYLHTPKNNNARTQMRVRTFPMSRDITRWARGDLNPHILSNTGT